MKDTVLIEEMTWVEVKAAIQGGKRRVIVMLAAMEQHGPHMPIGTDTYLGYATGERLARRLGDALVAPVVTLGYSAGHLPMPGTVSIEEPMLEAVILDVCRSLAHHGFREIILLCSHGGNYRALRNVVPRLRADLPSIRTPPSPTSTSGWSRRSDLPPLRGWTWRESASMPGRARRPSCLPTGRRWCRWTKPARDLPATHRSGGDRRSLRRRIL